MSYIALRSKMLDMQSASTERGKEQATRLEVVAANVQKIELATNSMKDALVQATKEKSFLEGEKSGKQQEQAKAAGIVESNRSFDQ